MVADLCYGGRFVSILADLLTTVFERQYKATGKDNWDKRQVSALADDLLSSEGEVSGTALACQILDRYAAMKPAEKQKFFGHLAKSMGIDPEKVRKTLTAYEDKPTKASYYSFMSAVEPARQELIRRLNQVPGATGQLVAMRSDLLQLSKKQPELAALDVDFSHLFTSWFNRGFLVLRPINWESPAHILEKIIAYEAVHTIESWDDLRRRLQPNDRRCFAFFHPSMPDEPLVFVEVAVTKGIPVSIQDVLSDGRKIIEVNDADTAVFYSISNCQAGLAGISFGNSLIKQVVADLARELPVLKTFITLSPIPALMKWLDETGRRGDVNDNEKLRKIAANYLLCAKRDNGSPYDPVARFHLGNGAQIHAVHTGADLSANGVAQSGGAMVNYLYDLSKITQNHERFATANKITASKEVRALSAAAST